MSEEEIIQEIEKLELEKEKEKVIKKLLGIIIEGEKEIIQEKEIFLKKKEKEIEELKKENIELIDQKTDGFLENEKLKNEIEKLQQKTINYDKTLERLQKDTISKDKIREKLGIEEDMAEEQILSYIDILVSENNRLEDIEDKKVQVAVDNIEKKRDKYWKEKIREKIKELDNVEIDKISREEYNRIEYAMEILLELLEE